MSILAESDYDGVELCLEHPELDPDTTDKWSISKIKEFLRNTDLEASAVSFHGKKSIWNEKKRKCIEGMRMARELNVDVFISGSILSKSPEKFTEMCLFSEEMCSVAEKLGIDFAIEPEPDTLINGSREMISLKNEVQSDRLKINLDIGHSYLTEDDVYHDIIRWGDDIVHTHIEDIKGKTHQHLLPGDGDLNFRKIISVLDKINYRGFLTLDLFDILDNPEYYTREGIRALQRELNG